MNRKKLVSLLLAALIMVILAAPASALVEGVTIIEGSCLLPDIEIAVTVSADSQVYINPLEIPININGKAEDGQIISEPAYIENKSVVPVQVNVTAAATINGSSDMLLSSSSTKGSTTTAKRAFVYFEIKASNDPESVTWDSAYNAGRHLVIRDYDRTKEKIATIGAGDNGKRYGVFRLTGDCIRNPRSPWTEEDGFDVFLTFTFKPLPTQQANS